MKTNSKKTERQYVALRVTGRNKTSGREELELVHVGKPGEQWMQVYIDAEEMLSQQDILLPLMVIITLPACKRYHHEAYENWLDARFSEATGGRDRRKDHTK